MKTPILSVLLLVAGVASAQTTRQHIPWGVLSETRGELIRVEGTNLIVRREASGAEPTEVTIDASDTKTFFIDEELAKFEDLKPGMMLRATTHSPRRGALRPESVLASSPFLRGSIVRVEARTLLLLSMTPEGRILEPRELKVGELTAGMRVRIIPPQGVARKILARAPTTVPTTHP